MVLTIDFPVKICSIAFVFVPVIFFLCVLNNFKTLFSVQFSYYELSSITVFEIKWKMK